MNDANRWEAVLARDGLADGAFVYAVRTTGVYCRPSCPSRRPRRENVTFFAFPEAAEWAGYRACRRCRPREAAPRHPQVEMVRRACHYIEAQMDGPPTLAALGAHVGSSPHHLQRTFRRLLGITPRQYADAHRVRRLKARLQAGETVTDAMYGAGFGSSRSLYERAPAQLGMTPATYRRGGAGARIGYTIVACPLGRLLVAATGRGVCAVSLGEDDGGMERALRDEYPAAQLQRDDDALRAWVAALLDHLAGQRPHLDLPLDVQATAFQWRVWEQLRAIPYGSTRSYSEIARALGQPTAARAVARACATNPVALIVPCHRVVREDGSASGYRWGLERKQSLLAQERAMAAAPGAPCPADEPTRCGRHILQTEDRESSDPAL